MNKHFQFFIFISQFLLAACSTTRHLPEGELLYTGTRGVEVVGDAPSPLRDKAIGEAKVAFVSPPNNALLGSSRYRTPLPLGLWAYNAFVGDSTGLGHWLFRTFATQPIYISTVNPTLRTEVALNTLHNYGYFDSHVSYRVDTLGGGRKAKLTYLLHLGPAWRYGKVERRGFLPAMDSLLLSTWPYRLLHEGEQVSYAALSGERSRLVAQLRDYGYYYLQPDMITLLADTASSTGELQVRITPHPDLPARATKPWYIGKVNFEIVNSEERIGKSDLNSNFLLIAQNPSLITPGSLYSATAQEAMLSSLNRIGTLDAVNISYTPRDSTDTLDVLLTTRLVPPYELSLEALLTAKSNDYAGPGVVASLSRRNLLHMGDIAQLRLKGSYEWYTGHATHHGESAANSFELGAEASLSAPTLLGMKRKALPFTHSSSLHLYADWLHRGGYYRLLAFGGNLTYALATSTVTHSITPASLTFNTLGRTTPQFDTLMAANPAIALSFRDQFIPSASYTLTLQKPTKLSLMLTSAGALTSLLYAASGHPWSEKDKSLLGTPYAQFVKSTLSACRYYPLAPHHTLATRLIVGILHAYGNSTSAPFSEQFHVGGGDDLRAFALRSIGPGSYHTTEPHAYVHHTGDIKLEANAEWRFPLAGALSGALFVDAGNVWTLRDDATRPGSQLRWKTLSRDLALGTGLGLRYNLRLVLLRLDVGVPLHAPYPTERHGYYNITHPWRSLCLHLGVGYPF